MKFWKGLNYANKFRAEKWVPVLFLEVNIVLRPNLEQWASCSLWNWGQIVAADKETR